MELIKKITKVYSKDTINVRIKTRNFAIVIMILLSTCCLLLPFSIIGGRGSVVPVVLLIVALSLTSLYLLKKGQFDKSSTIFLVFLGILPMLLSFTQAQMNYRDVYMYYALSTPFFVLSSIVAFKKFQIIMVGALQITCAIIFATFRIFTIPGVEASSVIFCLCIGGTFHVMITSLLIIALKVENRITISLEKDRKKSDDTVVMMKSLLNSTDRTLNSVKKVSEHLNGQTSLIENAVSRARGINSSMEDMNKIVLSRSEVVTNLVSQVDETKAVFSKNLDHIDALKKSSLLVFKALDVIENIVEETNLLAVNATIEAYQAGEKGKSFGVVANEIRNLAEKTSQNSKKIKEILSQNNQNLHKVDEGIIQSTEFFEKIRNKSLEVNNALDDILKGSNQVFENANDIQEIIKNMESLFQNANNLMNKVADSVTDVQRSFTGKI